MQTGEGRRPEGLPGLEHEVPQPLAPPEAARAAHVRSLTGGLANATWQLPNGSLCSNAVVFFFVVPLSCTFRAIFLLSLASRFPLPATSATHNDDFIFLSFFLQRKLSGLPLVCSSETLM